MALLAVCYSIYRARLLLPLFLRLAVRGRVIVLVVLVDAFIRHDQRDYLVAEQDDYHQYEYEQAVRRKEEGIQLVDDRDGPDIFALYLRVLDLWVDHRSYLVAFSAVIVCVAALFGLLSYAVGYHLAAELSLASVVGDDVAIVDILGGTFLDQYDVADLKGGRHTLGGNSEYMVAEYRRRLARQTGDKNEHHYGYHYDQQYSSQDIQYLFSHTTPPKEKALANSAYAFAYISPGASSG